MKDRTRIEDSLALAKELLNLQQLTVAQYGLQWRHIGISAQHEYPIEASLLGELAGIDLECRLTADGTALAQIAPVASVADQCLLTTPQRILGEKMLAGLGLRLDPKSRGFRKLMYRLFADSRRRARKGAAALGRNTCADAAGSSTSGRPSRTHAGRADTRLHGGPRQGSNLLARSTVT